MMIEPHLVAIAASRRQRSRVLVTGAAGFLGTLVCAELAGQGYTVRALDLPGVDIGPIRPHIDEFISADINGPRSELEQALSGCTHVVHAAATTNGLCADDYYRTNHRGTRNLLRAVEHSGVSLVRFVHISSIAARGPLRAATARCPPDGPGPVTEYGWSKRLAELEVLDRADRVPVTIIRPPPMYGPGDRQTLEVFRLASLGLDLQAGQGFRCLSLLFGPDGARAIGAALDAPLPSGTVLDLNGPAPINSNELAAAVIAAVGRTHHLRLHVPPPIFRTLARLADLVGKLKGAALPFNSFKTSEFLAPDWHIDSGPTQQALGWQPMMGLVEGMQYTAQWYRDNDWL